jgi:hypothetical protein
MVMFMLTHLSCFENLACATALMQQQEACELYVMFGEVTAMRHMAGLTRLLLLLQICYKLAVAAAALRLHPAK